MRTLLATSQDELVVARTTLVEVTASLFRAARGGSLSEAGARAAAADLLRRTGQDLFVVDVDALVLARALAIAERHALRGYDCIQLGTALVTHDQRLSAGLSPLVLVSADAELNAAAAAEGMTVEDPNAH